MIHKARQILALLFAFLLFSVKSSADFLFEDTSFQGEFTTENINRIIDAYELYDGWFWTTPADTDQTFHGQPERPGWTETAVVEWEKNGYLTGWYGCRWGVNQFSRWSPNRGGYGECFGFAQFIGYLLSGDTNPQGHWDKFYSLEKAGGLRVGDIIRVEYQSGGHSYHHSAVVYAIYGDEVSFLQVSSTDFNRISIDSSFTVGQYQDITFQEDLDQLPYLKISRAPQNRQE